MTLWGFPVMGYDQDSTGRLATFIVESCAGRVWANPSIRKGPCRAGRGF